MSVIEVEDLHVRYGPTVAVDGVSFEVREGEIFGILGPNGAGKTTTVEAIGGLRAPGAGRISVFGLDPRHDRDELRQQMGIQLQESQLPDKLQVGRAVPGRPRGGPRRGGALAVGDHPRRRPGPCARAGGDQPA